MPPQIPPYTYCCPEGHGRKEARLDAASYRRQRKEEDQRRMNRLMNQIVQLTPSIVSSQARRALASIHDRLKYECREFPWLKQCLVILSFTHSLIRRLQFRGGTRSFLEDLLFVGT
jgi:hypothetical protein